MSRPGGFEPGEDVLQVELEHVVRLIGPSGRELEILDDDHRLSTTIEVHPWIEADVALDRSEEARDELVEDLESSSWFTVGPTGVVTVHLALDRHPWWTLERPPSISRTPTTGRMVPGPTSVGSGSSRPRQPRAFQRPVRRGPEDRRPRPMPRPRPRDDRAGRAHPTPDRRDRARPELFDHLAASEDADEASASARSSRAGTSSRSPGSPRRTCDPARSVRRTPDEGRIGLGGEVPLRQDPGVPMIHRRRPLAITPIATSPPSSPPRHSPMASPRPGNATCRRRSPWSGSATARRSFSDGGNPIARDSRSWSRRGPSRRPRRSPGSMRRIPP